MISVDITLTILLIAAGFYMAWNIGANDVSNAMGTSIGSGALTLTKAVVIASILEFSGALLFGKHVSHTIQQGIVIPDIFSHDPKLLLYGMLSSLISTALWLHVASYFRWPVSTTHAIIGSIVGFGMVVGGVEAIHWSIMWKIAFSWVISPVTSGIFSYTIFMILQKQVFFNCSPIRATRKIIPLLVFIVLAVFSLTILSNGLGSFHLQLSLLERLPFIFIISAIGALASKVLVNRIQPSSYEHFISDNTLQKMISLKKALHHLNRIRITSKGDEQINIESILKKLKTYEEGLTSHPAYQIDHSHYRTVEKMFASLQILSASYVAFAHGANDVANAIGPLSAGLAIIREGRITLSETMPTYILALGGIGIIAGLTTWGWRVMETIGRKITALTPTRGFSAEFGAAITILIASKWGLPISTTHCIVGAVLGVGMARGIASLNLNTFRDILLSWIITIPASSVLCILIFHIIRATF